MFPLFELRVGKKTALMHSFIGSTSDYADKNFASKADRADGNDRDGKQQYRLYPIKRCGIEGHIEEHS